MFLIFQIFDKSFVVIDKFLWLGILIRLLKISHNWKFKTSKFHVSTYTGIPIFEFSFSITLQNISVEVESTVAIVNHSLQKEILHMGKVFVLRSKYKSKLSFCTKKGPNYGHVLKVQKKNSHKKVNSGIRLYMIRILDLLDFVYVCVCKRPT